MHFLNEIEPATFPALKIIIAKWDKQVHGILLCKAWRGINTHWYGKRTIACCGTENCPACDVGQKPVRKFYIVAKSLRTQNEAIVMLTPPAAGQILKHARLSTGVRGLEIVLGRAADRNTSPMTGRVCAYHHDTAEFPVDRLERILLRIFADNACVKSVEID